MQYGKSRHYKPKLNKDESLDMIESKKTIQLKTEISPTRRNSPLNRSRKSLYRTMQSTGFCQDGKSCNEEQKASIQEVALCLRCKRSMSGQRNRALALNR